MSWPARARRLGVSGRGRRQRPPPGLPGRPAVADSWYGRGGTSVHQHNLIAGLAAQGAALRGQSGADINGHGQPQCSVVADEGRIRA